MSVRLQSVLGRGVEVASAAVQDGKPGVRALVSYVVGLPGDPAQTVFGKLYPDEGRARQVHERLQALEALYADRPGLGVPRPLGLVSDLAMVVYAPAPGRPADELLATAGIDEALSRAAEWLAVLHGAELPLGRTFRLDEELVNLRVWAGVVTDAHPDEGGRAHALCDRLDEEAPDLDLPAASPIHKDFHPGHVIVDPRGGAVVVVDVDEMRWGDPDFDLAHGGAYLRLAAHRRGLSPDRADQLEGAFLRAYAEASGRSPGPSFGFFRRYTALKVAKQLSTQRGPRPRPAGERAAEELRFVLDGGLA